MSYPKPKARLTAPRWNGIFKTRGSSSVGQVNAALTLRDQLSGLAARARTLDQWALAHEFRQLPAIRRLLSRE